MCQSADFSIKNVPNFQFLSGCSHQRALFGQRPQPHDHKVDTRTTVKSESLRMIFTCDYKYNKQLESKSYLSLQVIRCRGKGKRGASAWQ